MGYVKHKKSGEMDLVEKSWTGSLFEDESGVLDWVLSWDTSEGNEGVIWIQEEEVTGWRVTCKGLFRKQRDDLTLGECLVS